MLRNLFTGKPNSIAAFDNLEAQFANSFANSDKASVLQRSSDLGHMVGDAVAAWIAGDGFAQLNNCPFIPAVGPGLWRPTPPAFVPHPLQPCWGGLRPFVLHSGTECAPPPPPSFSTTPGSELYGLALEDYDTVNNLTAEQMFIARFWADNAGQTGTPPGHWIDIVRQISQRESLDLGRSAEAFARVGIAVADAFIGC